MRCLVCFRRLTSGAPCPRHADPGGVAERVPDDTPAPRLAGFTELRHLGHGGTARVFAGRDATGREVAIKVGSRKSQARLEREATVLRKLGEARHGLAPALLAEGATEQGEPYLVLELLRGVPLSVWEEKLPDAGAASLAEIGPILAGLCDAVDRIHALGIVHRDLKPENVFLRDQPSGERVAVLDFGLARALGEVATFGPADSPELTRTGQRLGTILYMAPEQCVEARNVDERSDLYALGVILFELLVGRPPFVGDYVTVAQAHVGRRPPRPSELAPVHPALDAPVLRCLAKDRAQRYASAGELLTAFQQAAQQVGRSAAQILERARPKTPGRRDIALVALFTRTPASQLARAVAPDGGQVVRVHGERSVLAFTGTSTLIADGVRAAVHGAQRLLELCGETPIIVHVADLSVRESVRGCVVAGPAIERVETWWPPKAPGGVILSAEAAAALGGDPGQEEVSSERAVADVVSTQGTTATVPLRGRDALLGELRVLARQCAVSGEPRLVTLLGEPGHGKSRLLRELAAGMAQEPAFVSTALRASPADPDALARALLRVGLGVSERPTPAEVRAACAARGLPDETWPAVALAFDATEESDAPATWRAHIAQAIAIGLRARAAEDSLALFIDDAHAADDASLDALEQATRDPGPYLFVCLAALPELAARRPSLAASAQALAPLGRASARALLAELLRPVEITADARFDRVVDLAEGIPFHLVEIARALWTGGAVRKQRESSTWYLEPDEIFPPTSRQPLPERIADLAISSLSPQTLALATLCAVLGDEVTTAEVASALHKPDLRPGLLSPDLDAAVALDGLARRGILRPSGAGYGFRHRIFAEAVLARTPPEIVRGHHEVALHNLLSEGLPASRHQVLTRIATHATACDAREAAIDAYMSLAEDARRRDRRAEARSHYSSALGMLDESDPRRARILALQAGLS